MDPCIIVGSKIYPQLYCSILLHIVVLRQYWIRWCFLPTFMGLPLNYFVYLSFLHYIGVDGLPKHTACSADTDTIFENIGSAVAGKMTRLFTFG